MKDHPWMVRGRERCEFIRSVEKKISDFANKQEDSMCEYDLVGLLLKFLGKRIQMEVDSKENHPNSSVHSLFQEILEETAAFARLEEERDYLLAELLTHLAQSIIHPFRKRRIELEKLRPDIMYPID